MIYWSGFKPEVYEQQSHLISRVNKDLSKSVFSNFIPNYKDLATLSQIFNDELTVKKRVMLEKQIVKNMMSINEEQKEKMKPIDKLTFKTFIKIQRNLWRTSGGAREFWCNIFTLSLTMVSVLRLI